MTSGPYLCRIEYWTPTGWQHGHKGIAMLNPQSYVDRLVDRKKFARAIELGDDLRPTGVVWAPATLPARAKLVPTGTGVYGLPDPTRFEHCPWCERIHGDPFDGSCLV